MFRITTLMEIEKTLTEQEQMYVLSRHTYCHLLVNNLGITINFILHKNNFVSFASINFLKVNTNTYIFNRTDAKTTNVKCIHLSQNAKGSCINKLFSMYTTNDNRKTPV